VIAVGGGRCVGDPFSQHHVPGPDTLGMLGVWHVLGRRNVFPAREGGVEDEGEMSEAFCERAREVDQSIDWQVFSDQGGRDGRPRVEWE